MKHLNPILKLHGFLLKNFPFKKITLLVGFLFVGSLAFAELATTDFVTTWKTDNPGASSNTSISIPTAGTGYNYDVDWDNDGVFDELGITGNVTHDFAQVGTYTIRIRGDFPRIAFSGGGDKDKILDIVQWGNINWTSMYNAFKGCTNLISSATDSPNLLSVTGMGYMFSNANKFTGNLENWDVSNVLNMEYMFFNAYEFNSDISGWDVSKVVDMKYMFSNANKFNRNLGGWKLESSPNLLHMLDKCGLSVTQYDATLIGWAAQSGWTNTPVKELKLGAENLKFCNAQSNHDILTGANDLNWTINGDAHDCVPFKTTWKTDNPGASNNTSITIPTAGTGYNYDVDWDNDGVFDELGLTGNVTHDFAQVGTYTIRIRGDFPRIAFSGGGDKDKILDIVQWGNINWTSMYNAFKGCTNLMSSATDSPNLLSVTGMGYMFSNANKFTGNLENWDVSNVLNMEYMFFNAYEFNSDISGWDVSKVENMGYMFQGASKFNQPLSSWDVSQVTSMLAMFSKAIKFNQALINDLGDNTKNWDVSKVTTMAAMFAFANDFNQSLSTWDVSNVENMGYMFSSAKVFNQSLDAWNVSKVTNMQGMFSQATAYDQSLGAWKLDGKPNLMNMLDNSGLSSSSYDNTLVGWHNQTDWINNPVKDLSLGVEGLTYCTATTERNNLGDANVLNWTITGDNVCASLPVELGYLVAHLNQSTVTLEWETQSETNNRGFDVQKSRDGLSWVDIGWVEGKGTDRLPNQYEFVDEKPFGKANYYRLKQIDLDGKLNYSTVVNIYFHVSPSVVIFPNPAHEQITIKGLATKAVTAIHISNALGQNVLTTQETTIDVSHFPKGIYTIEVQLEQRVVLEKLIIK